jgi:hypothetical protein
MSYNAFKVVHLLGVVLFAVASVRRKQRHGSRRMISPGRRGTFGSVTQKP